MNAKVEITHKGMRLVDAKTGEPVCHGDERADFRGDKAKVTGGAAPQHGGSSGRIYVKLKGSKPDLGAEFYPSVFGAVWVAAEAPAGWAVADTSPEGA